MTLEHRFFIDRLGYAALLFNWHEHKIGDPMFQGETGRYWNSRMMAFEQENPIVANLVERNLGYQAWWRT